MEKKATRLGRRRTTRTRSPRSRRTSTTAPRADRRLRRGRRREEAQFEEGTETGTRTGTSNSSPRASSPRASSRSVSVSDPIVSDVSSAGRSVLPAASTPPTPSTLRSLGDARRRLAESIRVALSTGDISPDGSDSDGSNHDGSVRVSAETIRVAREILPRRRISTAMLRGRRAADRGADPSSRVHRGSVFPGDKSRASRGDEGGRRPFPRVVSRKVVETRQALVSALDAANRPATSTRLGTFGRQERLVALRDVLRRDNSSTSPGTTARGESRIRGESAWRIVTRRRGADRLRARRAPSDGDRGTLLHHLARTVAADRRLSCVSRRTRRHSRRRLRARRRRGSTPSSIVSTRRRERRRGNGALRGFRRTTRTRRSRDHSAISCATPRRTWRRCGRCRGRRRGGGETDGAVRAGAARGADVGGCASRVGGFAEAFGKAARETRNTRNTRRRRAEGTGMKRRRGGGNGDEEA